MCARLTTHGWRRSLLKTRRPIRIRLCRNSTKGAERARPPRLTLRLQAACTKLATPAAFPVNTLRTLFCLPQCFSLPAHRESSSSAECVSSHSPLLRRFSYWQSCGQRCSRYEVLCELAV